MPPRACVCMSARCTPCNITPHSARMHTCMTRLKLTVRTPLVGTGSRDHLTAGTGSSMLPPLSPYSAFASSLPTLNSVEKKVPTHNAPDSPFDGYASNLPVCMSACACACVCLQAGSYAYRDPYRKVCLTTRAHIHTPRACMHTAPQTASLPQSERDMVVDTIVDCRT